MKLSVAEIKAASNMTKRDYAVSLGLAKKSRGRMSPAAYAAIEAAEKAGVKFQPSATELAAQERTERLARGEIVKRGYRKGQLASEAPARAKTAKAEVVSTKIYAVVHQDKKPSKHLPAPHERGRGFSDEWYERLFQFGQFVCNPEGETLRVTSPGYPDEQGFTHFIDRHQVAKKARVTSSWGSATGFPERKTYTPTDED
jgi:hypothetical protein